MGEPGRFRRFGKVGWAGPGAPDCGREESQHLPLFNLGFGLTNFLSSIANDTVSKKGGRYACSDSVDHPFGCASTLLLTYEVEDSDQSWRSTGETGRKTIAEENVE